MTVRAYLGAKYYEDHRNRRDIEILSNLLKKNGIETICIARDIEQWGNTQLPSKELMQRTFYEIEHSDIVILEMSEKGVGLGIEAGYAYAKGKTIVVLIKEGKELSNTMQGVASIVISYRDPEEINLSINNQLIKQNPQTVISG
ncbi:MAG: nucleoside 2-deoxyribosyltransferase [Deltaproteobacteria bacterium]|nr:nucleoside 2-deoxyribosyltransferase [Deltaproteobacteria bacterium]